MNVLQGQSLKATSIRLILTLARSAEHALMYVRRRLSVFPPKVRLISERNKGFDWGVSLQCKGAPFIFFFLLPYLLVSLSPMSDTPGSISRFMLWRMATRSESPVSNWMAFMGKEYW